MSNLKWRWGAVAGCALAAMISGGRACASSINSEAMTDDTGAEQTELNIELWGDQTGELGSDFINPFGSGGSVSSSYNSSTNRTTVEFSVGSGGTPVENGQTVTVGIEEEQSGEEMGGKYWGPEESTPPEADELPAPTIFSTDQGTGPNTAYVIVTAMMKLGDGETSQEWLEQQINLNQAFQIGIGNHESQNESLTISGPKYFFSDTMIPLDQLNLTDEPPSSSQFSPLPGIPDGTTLSPGGTAFSSDIELPEPGSIAIAAIGTVLLGTRRGRRR